MEFGLTAGGSKPKHICSWTMQFITGTNHQMAQCWSPSTDKHVCLVVQAWYWIIVIMKAWFLYFLKIYYYNLC